MNELRFTHGQDHNNFLKDVEWTGTEEYVEESMWFPVSSATLSCYIQIKIKKYNYEVVFFFLFCPKKKSFLLFQLPFNHTLQTIL